MRLFSLCLIFLALYSCRKSIVPPAVFVPVSVKTALQISKGDSVSYLALGDSYTYGFGAPPDMSYPFQLADELRTQSYKAANPVVIAQFGWTAGDLLKGISQSTVTQKFDFVTLLIGVNDENMGTNTETYTTQFDQLLNIAIAYANGYSKRVFVISIPDWSVTPFAAKLDQSKIAAGVALFNSINMGQCEKLGVNYLDITQLSELAANDPTLTSSDGLHPSAKMYGLWANQFYSKVIATFN